MDRELGFVIKYKYNGFYFSGFRYGNSVSRWVESPKDARIFRVRCTAASHIKTLAEIGFRAEDFCIRAAVEDFDTLDVYDGGER